MDWFLYDRDLRHESVDYDGLSLILDFSAVLFNPSQCRKMVRRTLKILQQMLQDFKSVSDHFTTLRSNGLKYFY